MMRRSDIGRFAGILASICRVGAVPLAHMRHEPDTRYFRTVDYSGKTLPSAVDIAQPTSDNQRRPVSTPQSISARAQGPWVAAPGNHSDNLLAFLVLELSLRTAIPSRIAITSQCGGSYACDDKAFVKSFQNHKKYALRHGYEYFLVGKPMSKRFQPWDRYLVIRQLHDRGAEWVLTIEADSLFMNSAIGVEEIVERHGAGKDLIVSGDFNDHYLAGNVLMKNTPWVKNVICSAWKVCPSPGFDQLGAMMSVLGGGEPTHRETWQSAYDKVWGRGVTANEQADALSKLPKSTQEHLALLPQRAMNSYAAGYAPDEGAYHDGDWLIHFAGSHVKKEQVDRYAGMTSLADSSNGDDDCSEETFGFDSFCPA